jgi:hypothetical protein
MKGLLRFSGGTGRQAWWIEILTQNYIYAHLAYNLYFGIVERHWDFFLQCRRLFICAATTKQGEG